MRVKIFVLFLILSLRLNAQVEAPLLYFKRGMLWESFYYGKICPPFNNWQRINYGMDWPGFDPEWIGVDIGGPASHLVSGGFIIAGLDSTGKVIAAEDWAMYAGTVSPEQGAKYRVRKHAKTENHWQTKFPGPEEIIETVWEYNPDYQPTYQGDKPLPIRVERKAMQWSGSQADVNYIIIEYVIKNISNELNPNDKFGLYNATIYRMYILFTYAFSVNSRAWRILFYPQYSEGARNNRFFFIPTERLLFGYADDFSATVGRNEKYGYYDQGGPQRQGEWLAPGYPGLRFLYISPDSTGRANRINGYAWSAGDDRIDLYGPFGTAGIGLDGRYAICKDPRNAASVVVSPADPIWTTRRMWSLVSLGPWTLKPGDTIKIVAAEVIGGISYKETVTPGIDAGIVGNKGYNELLKNARRAQFNYDNRYNVPDPPPAPKFTVRLFDEKEGVIANVIEWYDSVEAIPDPDYSGLEAYDLVGYRIYRSNYLPIGPWELIVDIKKGDLNFYDSVKRKYKFIDTAVTVGFSYYYSITSYDTGHAYWPPNLSARFPETNSNRVPPMESSIFANRMTLPFKATIPPTNELDKILVVPNPFIARSGFLNPRDIDVIQFVNIPSPCTIRIYTIRGDLVKTIHHSDDSGIASWNQVTDYGQYVESGVYIYHIETPDGKKKIGKFAIIR